MGIAGSDVLVSSSVAVLLVNAAGDLPTQALGWEIQPRSQKAGTARKSLCGLSTTGQWTNNPALRSTLGKSVADKERDTGNGNAQDTGPKLSSPGLGRSQVQRACETGRTGSQGTGPEAPWVDTRGAWSWCWGDGWLSLLERLCGNGHITSTCSQDLSPARPRPCCIARRSLISEGLGCSICGTGWTVVWLRKQGPWKKTGVA